MIHKNLVKLTSELYMTHTGAKQLYETDMDQVTMPNCPNREGKIDTSIVHTVNAKPFDFKWLTGRP